MKLRIIIAPNSQLCNKLLEVLEFPGFVSFTMWMKGAVKREDSSNNQSTPFLPLSGCAQRTFMRNESPQYRSEKNAIKQLRGSFSIFVCKTDTFQLNVSEF